MLKALDLRSDGCLCHRGFEWVPLLAKCYQRRDQQPAASISWTEATWTFSYQTSWFLEPKMIFVVVLKSIFEDTAAANSKRQQQQQHLAAGSRVFLLAKNDDRRRKVLDATNQQLHHFPLKTNQTTVLLIRFFWVIPLTLVLHSTAESTENQLEFADNVLSPVWTPCVPRLNVCRRWRCIGTHENYAVCVLAGFRCSVTAACCGRLRRRERMVLQSTCADADNVAIVLRNTHAGESYKR